MIVREKSSALFEKAKTMFPGGVHSPVRAFKSVYGPPLFIERGAGCYMYDADGNQFTDFCCSWGPLILGHAHPEVVEEVQKTVARGMSFGTPGRLGNEIGELILDHHRYIEMIRFVSSGTEAVMSAIRLARGVTGKNKILKFEGCYHGHVDGLLVKAGSGLVTLGTSTSAGIPDAVAADTLVLPLDHEDALDEALSQYADDLACVIIEPIPANNGLLLQRRDFLMHLRKKCTEHGILLIFDEVISGFRVGFEGAAGQYGIQPDILTFGKIIGGGMPVGAYAASRGIMEHVAPVGPVYQAGTLSENPVAMAAGLATLKVLLREGFYENLDMRSSAFTLKLQTHCDQNNYPVSIVRAGSIFWIAFSREKISNSSQIDPGSMEHFKTLHAFLLDHGIYLGPSGYEVGFVSSAHTEEVLEASAKVINRGFDHVFASS